MTDEHSEDGDPSFAELVTKSIVTGEAVAHGKSTKQAIEEVVIQAGYSCNFVPSGETVVKNDGYITSKLPKNNLARSRFQEASEGCWVINKGQFEGNYTIKKYFQNFYFIT